MTRPDLVIRTVQEKIFKLVWKNKRDKVKRSVIFQPLSRGGLNFPDFRTQVKSLRLGRLLHSSNEIETRREFRMNIIINTEG